jgi:hypothetical protein
MVTATENIMKNRIKTKWTALIRYGINGAPCLESSTNIANSYIPTAADTGTC